MHFKLSHLPLLKIVLPILLGVFSLNFLTLPFNIIFGISCTLFVFLVIFNLKIKSKFSKKYISIFISLFLFLLGGIMISSKKIEAQQNHFSKFSNSFARGIITAPLEEKEKSYKTIIGINSLLDSNLNPTIVSGNILVYLEKDTVFSSLEIGDEVVFYLSPNKVERPKNIGQFDYKDYLSHKDIFHQQYISSGELRLIQKHKNLGFKRTCNNIGIYIQKILKKYILKTENFNLADGILLGHRNDIDIDLYNAFAYTGILHILSVSGLHVGIIYVLLAFLLSFIKDKNKKIKIAKFIFSVFFIWMFAFVTGFSAACVRAAILFSLLQYSKISKENSNNLNLLAGAALIQLFLDPNNLFDIGFQLSYLAMLGLFLFTKPIQTILYHQNKIINWMFQLWAASIAAQVFTVPLSIYYFGSFPTYFLFANIFAIPISALILWLSILLIPLSFIPFLGKAVGWLASFVIDIFIYLTYFFSNLPLGKLTNLYITKSQLILLFIGIICIAFFVLKRNGKYIIIAFSIFLFTILLSYTYTLSQYKKDKIIFYSVSKNLVIGYNKNNKQILISKDSISEKEFSFNIKNSYRILRIQQHNSILLDDSTSKKNLYLSSDLLYINGKSFYLLSKENYNKQFESALEIDYLLITDNCYLDVGKMIKNYHYKTCILSSDNDTRHIKIYRKILEKQKIPFIDLSEHFYQID